MGYGTWNSPRGRVVVRLPLFLSLYGFRPEGRGGAQRRMVGARGAILKGETTILCAGEPRSRGTLARRALGWIRVGSARGERARQAVRNVPAPGHGAGTRACGPAWRLGQPDNHLSFGRFLSLLLSFLRVFCKVSFLVFSSKVGATSIVNNTLNLPIHSAK